MDTLLLIDGHNLLFRMFYGMPDTFRTPQGRKYNAVYGFASAVEKAAALLKPTHMLVVFDSQDCGDRRTLDTAYKANRPDFSDADPDDCPFTQLPAIYSVLDSLGVCHLEARGCEADDLIASYVGKVSGRMHTVIFSTDRDYWQLISDTVSVLDYHGMDSSLVTPSTVFRKYGVSPAQFADFKCLIGDKSDNISGVPGVGPKRAAELLNRFGSLDGILAHTDEIERPAVRAALESSAERLDTNRRLICLTGDAPLPAVPETLSFRFRPTVSVLSLAMQAADAAAEEIHA